MSEVQTRLERFGSPGDSEGNTSDDVTTKDQFGEAKIEFTVDGETHTGTIIEGDNESMEVDVNGQRITIVSDDESVYTDNGSYQRTITYLEFLDGDSNE